MDPNDAAAPFLPTLARARAAHLDLPSEAPTEERRLAERACTMCAASPGRVRCRVCVGQGRVADGSLLGAACSCEGGSVLCAQCDGTGRSVRVSVRYVFDRPIALREIYVPAELSCVPALFSFESAFEAIVGAAAAPPECLRCHDLRPRAAGTAYRGGGRLVAPDFRGHGFGDVIDKATAALDAIGKGGKLVRSAIRAYAWPLLWLRYPFGVDPREAIVFAGPDGALQAIAGRPGGAG